MTFVWKKQTNLIRRKNKSYQSARERKEQSPFFMNHYNILSISLTIKPDANDMNIKSERKSSSCASGSLTVEAAFVFPILLFFLLTILYLFQMQRLQLEVREALYDAAQNIAASSYAMEAVNEKTGAELADLLEGGTGEFTLQNEIKDPSLLMLITGGRAGVLCSNESDDNEVILKANLFLRLPNLIFGKRSFLLQEKVCVKRWTGYDPNSGDKGDMVYVTQYGEVYHTDRDCSYLNPSIHVVTREELTTKRSEDGGIYKKCPLCGKKAGAVCYITDYGEVYHSSLSCSGLKRTVYCLPEDQAEKKACSKCGGDHSE